MHSVPVSFATDGGDGRMSSSSGFTVLCEATSGPFVHIGILRLAWEAGSCAYLSFVGAYADASEDEFASYYYDGINDRQYNRILVCLQYCGGAAFLGISILKTYFLLFQSGDERSRNDNGKFSDNW